MKIKLTIDSPGAYGTVTVDGSLPEFEVMVRFAKAFNKANPLPAQPSVSVEAEGFVDPRELHAFVNNQEVKLITERVDQYRPEVERILQALGHPEALVSDQARVIDLMAVGGSSDDTMQADIDYAFGPLGLKGVITPDTLIVDAAAMLRASSHPQH